ncbi:MAG: hypothetical protein GXP30_06235 [Verrucomicrobia bacterium]|nr:hypothetical protein [Verrucomicrobiota bacterium]
MKTENSNYIGIGFALMLLVNGASLRAELPKDEAGIVAFFEQAGARISRNDEDRAVKIFSGGKPQHSVEELQLLGRLPHLEEIAMNSPLAGDKDWGFLHHLPKLKKLTIWHGHHFTSLSIFSDLPIESLTVGGCMGLRDLNKGQPEKQRNAVLSLTQLPNLTKLNLYHSPLIPGDEQLAHIVKQFPQLDDLKLDFNAPRGTETTISPSGLKGLQKLPLKTLSIENANTFTVDHMKAIAGIKTLEVLLIDARKNSFDTAALVASLKEQRPGLDIQVAGKGAKGPPRPGKR